MWVVLLCSLILLGAAPGAQDAVQHQRQLLRAVEQYRAGDTEAALAVITAVSHDLRRDTARSVVESSRRGRMPFAEAPHWNVQRLRGAGALHMEAALQTYLRSRPQSDGAVEALASIGEMYLDEVGRLEQRPSDAIRWNWAIGGQALSDGAIETARQLLFHSCQRYPGQVSLLLACGIVHEAIAGLNVDIEVVLRHIHPGVHSLVGGDPSIRTLQRERADRDKQFDYAAQLFEQVRSIDAANQEAALRLGHVRLKQGKSAEAARMLQPLVLTSVDQRTDYLARLLLGRAREQRKDHAGATTLFREAVAILPAQSARLALAHRRYADGAAAEAAGLAEALTDESKIDDPWWSYRFGQYWLIDLVLASLRAEARQ